MTTKQNIFLNKLAGLRRYTSIIVIVLNVLLLSGVFILYLRYTSLYQERLHEENLGNIANLNKSAVTNSTALFNSWNIKLNDIVKYIGTHDLTHDETLAMISETNSSEDRYFELIGSNHTGYLAAKNSDGTYPALDYSNRSYSALHSIFSDAADSTYSDIRFAPEFTDGGESAEKFFAIYKHISLKNEQGQLEPYTLMLATRSKDVLAVLNSQEDYAGQSTVLIDANGNYIVSNHDFKSANFYKYLYVYNDLTLDQQNSIQSEMEAKGSGELYYKNAGAVVQDCVFRYERIAVNGWYCVTCVPLSSFRSPAFNINYTIYACVLLLALFIVDVLWLQNMNRRLRVSMKREREANAAKGNFMSKMSHEIRTPLNAVIGYNTLARNEMTGAQSDIERRQAEIKAMDCLAKSDIASKHLLAIINDVLDISAIESGKIKPVNESFDFKALITSLTTIFYSQARSKGVDFEVIFDTLTEEWFIGDQMRTNQILTNLLSNAIKFTPEGGTVKMTVCQPEADTNASHIHFEVMDTGIGMTQEYLTHIWTPFEQADSSISRRFGGTGLGLPITKNLVDLMNGCITVESTLGVGSKFIVDLTFGRMEQPQNEGTYDFSNINALVIDDDISTCEYITLLFNRCGAKCTSVTSGEDALKAMSRALKENALYNLCLVDWRMPRMDGIETIKRIRRIVGEMLPIIVLTAYDYTELADKAAEVGVSQFISKPLFQSSLFDLLANIAGKKASKTLEKNKKFDFGGARVLLAEDNMMNMEIAKKLMESAGLVVDSAWNGQEAVDMFNASDPDIYTAILTDIHMPVLNGHDVARAIRNSSHPNAKTIPIIAMTADAFAENVAEALASGMNDHISKPIDVQALFEMLRKYIPTEK